MLEVVFLPIRPPACGGYPEALAGMAEMAITVGSVILGDR
jgi:hypothetical protein